MDGPIKKVLIASCAVASLCALLSSCATESPTASGKSLQKTGAAANSETAVVRITNPLDSAFINLGNTVLIEAVVGDSLGDSSNSWRGTVSFYRNGTLIGQDSVSPYNCLWNASTQGTFALQAVAKAASGKADTSAPVTVTVGIRHYPPMVSIYQPLNGAIVFRGDAVTIAASAWVTDSQSHITRVVFYKNGVRIGVDNTAPYAFSWKDTSRGVFTFTAKAFDSKGDSGISSPVIVTRQDGFIVLSAPVDSQIFQLGDSVIILAKAAGTQFHTIKNVKFYRNNTLITTLTTVPYRYVWRNGAQGIYRIKAIAVDTKGMLDTSATATIYIKKIPPMVYISEPANNSSVKAGSTIAISAWAYTPDSSGSISYVKIYRNGKLLTTDYTAPYTYTWTNAALGVYTLTAVASNNRGVLGYSDTVKVSVVSKIPAIAITAPASGDTFSPNTPVTVQTSLTGFGSVAYVRFLVDSMGYTFVDSIAPYTADIQGLSPCYHSISAVAVVAPGVDYTATPVYIIVKEFQVPNVSITSPKDSSSFSSSQSIAIQASASSANGSILRVQFFRDSVFLGMDSTSPYSFTWASPPKGSYEFRASATDSYGVTGSSQNVYITVR